MCHKQTHLFSVSRQGLERGLRGRKRGTRMKLSTHVSYGCALKPRSPLQQSLQSLERCDVVECLAAAGPRGPHIHAFVHNACTCLHVSQETPHCTLLAREESVHLYTCLCRSAFGWRLSTGQRGFSSLETQPFSVTHQLHILLNKLIGCS